MNIYTQKTKITTADSSKEILDKIFTDNIKALFSSKKDTK